MLCALSRKIRESSQEMNGQAIGSALYGLQNMKSDSAEFLSVLNALEVKIEESSRVMEGKPIGNLSYDLQNMHIASAELRFVLDEFRRKHVICAYKINIDGYINGL